LDEKILHFNSHTIFKHLHNKMMVQKKCAM